MISDCVRNQLPQRKAIADLALCGIAIDSQPERAGSFVRDLLPILCSGFVLADPPFNDSDGFRKDDYVRWSHGLPPKGEANFTSVQHFIKQLAPQGMTGFVLSKSFNNTPLAFLS